MLLQKKIYACGTVRVNRQDWPTEFKNPKTMKLQPCEFVQRQSDTLTATVWHDKRDVCLLSNDCDPTEKCFRIRKKGTGNQTVFLPCPKPIHEYVQNMYVRNIKNGGSTFFFRD